ncbi:MAG: hypothetical protein EOO88_13250 [Pedobacter sp.]|nr:MAG: hypothetical protein EOO88_13250 [Pedobacter sp.]
MRSPIKNIMFRPHNRYSFPIKSVRAQIATLLLLFLMHICLLNAHGQVPESDVSRVGISIPANALMEMIIPAFRAKYRNIELKTLKDQTGIVVDSVITGYASIAVTTRNIKVYELEKAPSLKGTPIGLDGLVLTVSKTNPVKMLTFDQISDIYTGKITNWKEVGGKNIPIQVIGRNREYDPINLFADFMQLESKILHGEIFFSHKGNPVFSRIPAWAPPTDLEAMMMLNINENAITYFPLQVLLDYQKRDYDVKPLLFNGVKATYQTLSNGRYFIHRRLNAITMGNPTGTEQLLLDFLLSNQGQSLILNAGFLPINMNIR